MKYQPIKFDTLKAAQAAAVLLRREGANSMTRLRLVKLFYMANRRMLKEHGRSIVDDRFVAMQHGPVPSVIYELVKGGGHNEPLWGRFIRSEGARNIKLVDDPGVSQLSPAEIEVLNAVTDEMAPYTEWEIVEMMHKSYREWIDNYPDPNESTSRAIPLEQVLAAVGMEEQTPRILQHLQDEADFDRLFA